MKSTTLLFGAAAMALLPGFASAAPGGNRSPSADSTASSSLIGPLTTGQPGADCEAIVDAGGSTPGNSANAPGSAFNPAGVSGSVYAGEQPQNSKNPASVSQYDVACANQPQ